MLKTLSKMYYKEWSEVELQILLDYYMICTPLELSKFLPGRSLNSIHSKVKRLRKEHKLVGNKAPVTLDRAKKQGIPHYMK